MKRYSGEVPDSYACANCGRNLLTADYEMHPPADEEEERIHRVVDPREPPFSLLCTCGHFTIVESG